MRLLKTLFLFSFIMLSQLGRAQFYNGSKQTFGKNRIQYGAPKDWVFYRFEKFDTYFYSGGKELADYVSQVSGELIQSIEEQYEFTLNDKIELVVFNSHSDFKQSNIDIDGGEEFSIAGKTLVSGSKIFLFYEGTHADFKKQIRNGIAEVVLRQIMLGSRWREVFQGSSYSNLPDWFTHGFIEYSGAGWTVELDDINRDNILSNNFDDVFWSSGENASQKGAALWNFIHKAYGKEAVNNIIYMTRATKNPQSGFLYVLGFDLDMLLFSVKNYYYKIYTKDVKDRQVTDQKDISIKTKKNRTYDKYVVSPNGKYAAYTTNKLGQYKIFIYDLVKNKKKRILKAEHKLERIIDHTFPIVKWVPNSKVLSYVVEKKGKVFLVNFDLKKKKKSERELKGVSKVLDFNYSEDGQKAIVSAVSKGETDIYLYTVLGNGLTNITKDPFDNINPSFLEGSNKIIFSSNRPDDTIRRKYDDFDPMDDFDLYIYDLNDATKIERVTKTEGVNELSAFKYKKGITFLSDRNGIVNRYYGIKDSTIDYIDTAIHYRYFYDLEALSNNSRNLKEYHVYDSRYSYFYEKEGKNIFVYGVIDQDSTIDISNITNTRFFKKKTKATKTKNTFSNIEKSSKSDSTNNRIYVDSKHRYEREVVTFEETLPQESFNTKEVNPNLVANSKVSNDTTKVRFSMPATKNYFVNFTTDRSMVRLDFEYLNAAYQTFSSDAPEFRNPGVNAMMKWALSDLFEDYKLMAGFRLGGNLKDHEILLMYRDLKKRLDKEIVLYKGSTFTTFNDYYYKFHTYNAKYILKFPINEVLALRGTFDYRLDQNVPLSTDDRSLAEPMSFVNNGGGKLELVFDDTRNKELNIKHGTRYKIWGEYYKVIGEKETDIFIVGGDFRYYIPIYRNITLATRIAASTSFGSRKLLYFMGGVDDWIGPKYNSDNQIDFTQNFYFQTLATPVRGFYQNTRNGASMAVSNYELRIPLASTFSNAPVTNRFIRNLQLVGFFDMGLAWNGLNPYSTENSFNVKQVVKDPLTITVENQKEPIIYGVGAGFRTKFMGYYVKGDLAWGVEDGEVLKPLFHFSFGYGF